MRLQEKVCNYVAVLEDAQMINEFPWDIAYYDCKDKCEYLDTHIDKFNERFSPKKILAFFFDFIIALAALLVCVYHFLNASLTIFLILSIILVIIFLVGRVVYYDDMDCRITIALNRLEAYDNTWPGIVELAQEKLSENDMSLPEELDKTAVPLTNFSGLDNVEIRLDDIKTGKVDDSLEKAIKALNNRPV